MAGKKKRHYSCYIVIVWYFNIYGLRNLNLFFILAESGSHQNEVYFHVRRQNRPESWDVSSWPLRDHDVQHSRTVRTTIRSCTQGFWFLIWFSRIQAFHWPLLWLVGKKVDPEGFAHKLKNRFEMNKILFLLFPSGFGLSSLSIVDTKSFFGLLTFDNRCQGNENFFDFFAISQCLWSYFVSFIVAKWWSLGLWFMNDMNHQSW